MVSPQTARNGIVAIDPHATRGDETRDHGLTRTNDDVSRFGMMPSRGGVRRSIQRNEKARIGSFRSISSLLSGERAAQCT